MLAPFQTNTILYCDDWDAAIDFYAKSLGLPIRYQNDWFVEFELNAGSSISIANANRASIAAGKGAGLTISWQVGDLETVRQQLECAGVATSPPRQQWGGRGCFFYDPSGNRLEVWERTDSSEGRSPTG